MDDVLETTNNDDGFTRVLDALDDLQETLQAACSLLYGAIDEDEETDGESE